MKGFTVASASNLADMKLPELKEIARQMGLRGVSTMRKPQLVATLQAARTGGKAPAGVTVGVPRVGRRPVAHSTASASSASSASTHSSSASTSAASAAPQNPRRSQQQSEQPGQQPERRSEQSGSPELPLPDRSTFVDSRSHKLSPKHFGTNRDARLGHIEDLDFGIRLPSRSRTNEQEDAEHARRLRRQAAHPAHSLDDILATLPDRSKGDEEDDGARRRRPHRVVRTAGPAASRTRSDEDDSMPEIRTYRLAEEDDEHRDDQREENREGRSQNGRYSRSEREEEGEERTDRSRRTRQERRHGRENERRENDREGRLNDRSRRYDRRRRENEGDEAEADEEPRQEQEEQETPVAGIVDLLDSYAFIRTSGYLPGPNDVYVSMGMVRKYGLRKGDAVQGTIRVGGNNNRRNNRRQKFVPIRTITSINGMSVEDAAKRPQFEKLTPIYPSERLKMETSQNKLIGRMIDIVSPIGKGQRGLIVSPPKAGKTVTLQAIANAIHENNPECHIMVVLVDERPEEVTDMKRTVHGEVISSTFDKPASEHTVAAEMAIERAKRLVEMGQDVVVLLDSMTRLARAYNIVAPASGRVLSGGVDAQALYPPKRFFGAARNIENGGSLTIIASALVETGSKMDEVIFEEFKGTGNMELRLSRGLADKRMFPAIDVNASGTRREELLTSPEQLRIIYGLRRAFGDLEPEQVYSRLVPLLKKTPSNEMFFSAIAQHMNISVNH